MEKQMNEVDLLNKSIVLEDSSASEETDIDETSFVAAGPSTNSKRKRGRKNMLTSAVLSTLDRTKMSDRHAVHNLSASGPQIDQFNVNRSSIQRARQKHREVTSKKLKSEFCREQTLTLHWDGKLMAELTGDKKVDSLPTVVSGNGIEQLLCVPKLQAGSGQAIANALYDNVKDWELENCICSICFDTTASNTGKKKGACVLFEQMLEKDILYLACRHHIHEIMLQAVFFATMGPSTSPDIPLFMRFKNSWIQISADDYQPGIKDVEVANALQRVKTDVLQFCLQQIEEAQPRNDYNELLELSIIFVGGIPPKGVHFAKPGAIHRARFMARLIYALKIFVFRHQFNLTSSEFTGIKQLCIFGIKHYIKSWFTSRLPIEATKNDLELLKSLANESCSPANKALKKLANHLWYLSEELVALALFDSNVTLEEKRRMTAALQRKSEKKASKRVSVEIENIQTKELHDFVTDNTRNFFTILNLNHDFL